jgi:hypothetical protein
LDLKDSKYFSKIYIKIRLLGHFWHFIYNKHEKMKFVSDLRQVCGFLWVLLFTPPIKLNTTI